MTAAIRPGRDDDAAGFIRVVSGCWAEYPGCVIDIEGEAPELFALASYTAGRGGQVWAAEQDGTVQGLVCTYPRADGAWEIGKMYVASGLRGGGVAQTLLRTAEDFARAHGAARMKLWSDTRFDRAHRFYEKHSYVRSGPIRPIADKSNTIEFAYAKPLSGIAVERLDAAAAAAAEVPLARILAACVNDGAAVSFIAPLAMDRARAFWKSVAGGVARGERILLAAWLDGAMVGTVQVDLAMPQNQPHRGDVAKMLVHPEARRRGIARLLVARAEAEAAAAGRHVLVLDTREGDSAEALYRAAGWNEVGRIPDYALNSDGTPHATVYFFKRV